MGNYTADEFIELFGGLPERGDCAPDPDEIREQAEEREREEAASALPGEQR